MWKTLKQMRDSFTNGYISEKSLNNQSWEEPGGTERSPCANGSTPKCEMTISRRSSVFGFGIKYTVLLDGAYIGMLQNGGSTVTTVSVGDHTISFYRKHSGEEPELIRSFSVSSKLCSIHFAVGVEFPQGTLKVYESCQNTIENCTSKLTKKVISNELDEESLQIKNSSRWAYFLDSAMFVIFETGQASASMLQRRLKIGYTQASKILNLAESLGLIGPFIATSPRKVLITKDIYLSKRTDILKTIASMETQQEKKWQDKFLLSKIGIDPKLDFSEIDPMKVIIAMERNLELLYSKFISSATTLATGEKIFSSFKETCLSYKLPLAAEVRLESLLAEYEPKFSLSNPFHAIDQMEGHEFEQWCACLLKQNGFTDVEVTKGSGDQGVDILAVKDEIRYAVQCKCYSSDIGNTSVQQVHAGKSLYHCQVGVVMTNRYFTAGAKELAKATGVLLWDRDKLQKMLEVQT